MSSELTREENQKAKSISMVVAPGVGMAPFVLSITLYSFFFGAYSLLILCLPPLMCWQFLRELHSEDQMFRNAAWAVTALSAIGVILGETIDGRFFLVFIPIFIAWTPILASRVNKKITSAIIAERSGNTAERR